MCFLVIRKVARVDESATPSGNSLRKPKHDGRGSGEAICWKVVVGEIT